jgi:hypothetical protein
MTSLVSSTYLVAHDVALFLNGAVDEVPDPDDVRPGWIALGSFLLLAFVTVLLWLSMRKQLRRIDFDEEGDAPGADDVADGPVDTEAAAEAEAENGDQRA